MAHKPSSTDSPDQAPNKFLEIYQKMTRDSQSLAQQIAALAEQENKKPKKDGQAS